MIGVLGDGKILGLVEVFVHGDSAHGIECEVAPFAGIFDVAGGEADALGIAVVQVAAQDAVGVGLEEMRVGRAVGEDLVDVDIHDVRIADIDVVDALRGTVEVGGDLKVKFADAMIGRELDVLEAFFDDGGVGGQAEALRGKAKCGAGDGVVEAVAG